MKSWVLRIRSKDRNIFNEIKDGQKIYETRAASKRYQNIEAGDTLVFVCGHKKIQKKVAKRFHWSSVDKMAKEIPFKQIMPSVKSVNEMKMVYLSYPGYKEKIRKFGILGYKLK